MVYEDIRLSKNRAVATITIDRPAVLNAIRYKTMLEIQDALNDIEQDDAIRVVVITGSGEKAFISGGDISVMAGEKGVVDVLYEMSAGHEIGFNIETFRKPVIARINGIALGGGTEIALCCDIRVAVDAAIMGVPEVNLGIIPGYGGTQRLPRIVGIGKAKQMVFTGDHISALEAHRIGLVDVVASRTDLDPVVEEMCRKIAAKSPIALSMGKQAINQGMQTDMRTAMAIEAKCFCVCFGSEDRIEGMKAFLEKRKPAFKGR
jgi:enoyl-CoA hydratase